MFWQIIPKTHRISHYTKQILPKLQQKLLKAISLNSQTSFIVFGKHAGNFSFIINIYENFAVRNNLLIVLKGKLGVVLRTMGPINKEPKCATFRAIFSMIGHIWLKSL